MHVKKTREENVEIVLIDHQKEYGFVKVANKKKHVRVFQMDIDSWRNFKPNNEM